MQSMANKYDKTDLGKVNPGMLNKGQWAAYLDDEKDNGVTGLIQNWVHSL